MPQLADFTAKITTIYWRIRYLDHILVSKIYKIFFHNLINIFIGNTNYDGVNKPKTSKISELAYLYLYFDHEDSNFCNSEQHWATIFFGPFLQYFGSYLVLWSNEYLSYFCFDCFKLLEVWYVKYKNITLKK